jgi:hypothetical protein
MESVFHKHHWDRDARRSIALAEVHSRGRRQLFWPLDDNYLGR